MEYELYKTKVSDTISLMRFPLAVLVVIIHVSSISGAYQLEQSSLSQNYPCFYCLSNCLKFLTNAAVPLFFVISGYLFFLDKDWSLSTYFSQLKKRVKTLLVPYLVWNSIMLLMKAVAAILVPEKYEWGMKSVLQYDLKDYIARYISMNFVDGSMTMPIHLVTWFLRDLMLVVLLSPIIYALIKRVGVFLPVACILAYVVFSESYGVLTAFTFFAIGAYVAIRKPCIPDRKNVVNLCVISVLILMSILCKDQPYGGKFLTLLGCWIVASIGFYLSNHKLKIPKILTDSSFLIYVVHVCLFMPLKVLLPRMFPPSDFSLCAIYILSVIIIVAIIVPLNIFLDKHLSRYQWIFNAKIK